MLKSNAIMQARDINESQLDLSWYIVMKLNWESIKDKEDLIGEIYEQLWCPKNFWKNWDAFWDTITDNEFWVKKPLILIFENYKKIFWINIEDRYILSDILIDLLNEQRQKYYIFLK